MNQIRKLSKATIACGAYWLDATTYIAAAVRSYWADYRLDARDWEDIATLFYGPDALRNRQEDK